MDKICNQLVLRKDGLPNSSQPANVSKLWTSYPAVWQAFQHFQIDPSSGKCAQNSQVYFLKFGCHSCQWFCINSFCGNTQLGQLCQTCKMLYLLDRYLALSMNYLIQTFSVCHCMLKWKRGSFQWILTDCLQNQNFLKESLD